MVAATPALTDVSLAAAVSEAAPVELAAETNVFDLVADAADVVTARPELVTKVAPPCVV